MMKGIQANLVQEAGLLVEQGTLLLEAAVLHQRTKLLRMITDRHQLHPLYILLVAISLAVPGSFKI